MHAYICPRCGLYLDPGEKCDCLKTQERNRQIVDELLVEDQDGQMTLRETMKRQYRNYMEVEHGNII